MLQNICSELLLIVNYGNMKGDLEDMGMLKSITLENYKCFKNKTEIDIAPLTVLCGVNSSGKSSILKSLLMLKQSYESGSDYNSIMLNGDYTSNGTFTDVTYNCYGNYFTISNTFELYNHNFPTSQEKHTFKELKKIYSNVNEIKKATISINIMLKKKNLSKLNITDNLVSLYDIEICLIDKNNMPYNSSIHLIHKNEKIYDIKTCGICNFENIVLSQCSCYFEGLKLVNLYYDKVEPKDTNTDILLSYIFSIFRIIPLQYSSIHYIAPLRNEPVRTYLLQQDRNFVGLHGEYTPQVILDNLSKEFSSILPPFDDKFVMHSQKSTFEYALNLWLCYLGIERVKPVVSSDSIRLFIGNHNILDVGFGISQILPIITTGLLMKRGESIILQQPEIHLHPKMQMNFADFLLSISLKNKNVIIETHSDHIINRIVRRVMEDKSKKLNEKIKIYFVDKNNYEKPVKQLKIDMVRGFTDVPDDFFSQFSSESMKIFNAGTDNM